MPFLIHHKGLYTTIWSNFQDNFHYSLRAGLRDYEPETRDKIVELAKSSNTFVNVGAYTGLMCALAAKSNPALQIVAVEPNPMLSELLELNLCSNSSPGQYIIHRFGLGDFEGTAPYVNPEFIFNTASTSSYFNFDASSDTKESINSTSSEIKTLDSLCLNVERGLILIDSEGSELQILKDAMNTLERFMPTLIIESWIEEGAGKINQLLEPLGYRATETLDSSPRFFNRLYVGISSR
jgi:FkbM family methyltransferase